MEVLAPSHKSPQPKSEANQRLIQTKLHVTRQPKTSTRPIDSCQLDQIDRSTSSANQQIISLGKNKPDAPNQALSSFVELNCDCELENLNKDIWLKSVTLYVCCSILFWRDELYSKMSHSFDSMRSRVAEYSASIDGQSPIELKCFDPIVRFKSQHVLKNASNPNLLTNLQNSYVFEVDRETMCANIHSLAIVRRSQFEMKEMVEKLVLQETAALNTSSTAAANTTASLNSKDLDLDQLSLQALQALEKQKSELLERINSISDTICLKLQVLIYDNQKNKWETFLTEPVYTNPISLRVSNLRKNLSLSLQARNEKASLNSLLNTEMTDDYGSADSESTADSASILDSNSLKIFRSSRIYGRVDGGDEIILLTSFLDPTDIQVEFFQFKNDTEIGWRSLAVLNKIDIHGNCSLVFRTPAYRPALAINSISNSSLPSTTSSDLSKKLINSTNNQTASKPHSRIKVYYRLCRPSTGEHSDKWVFFYCQDYVYDEYRVFFGDRIVNDSRLLTRLFATSHIGASSSEIGTKNSPSMTSLPINSNVSNKRKIDAVANDTNEQEAAVAMIKMEPMDTSAAMGGNETLNEVDETSSSKKMLKKWYKKEIVERTKKNEISKLPKMDGVGGDMAENDDEMSDEQRVKIIECVINTPTSSICTNDDDETSGGGGCGSGGVGDSKSPSLPFNRHGKIEKRDCETQTNLEDMLKPSVVDVDEQKIDSKAKMTPSFAEYFQLKNNHESCINKMNSLAERTSKALLKFAQNRSLRDFMKTHRFLLGTQDEDGNTALHLAILYGNLDLLMVFVDVAATIAFQNIINIKNNKQFTALMIAAYLEEVEVCEYLLEANADITIEDSFGCNVIHIACKKKNLELLKVILKYVNKNNCYNVLNAINHEGLAPIHLAVLSESMEILNELLYNRKYLKINILDKRRGYTALHYAAMRSKLTPMLANGALLNLQSKVPVHFDWEVFQTTQRMGTCLQRCIERIFQERKRITTTTATIKKEPTLVEADTTKNLENEKSQTTETETATTTTTTTTTAQSTTSGGSNMPFPNLGSSSEFVKLSQEVKKQYESELEKMRQLEEESATGTSASGGSSAASIRSRSKFPISQHNFDAFYYAQNDAWMLEIFKAKETLPRSLIEKVICFDRVKDFASENRIGLSNEVVKEFMQKTQEALDNLKTRAQIKISQQATEDNEPISSTTSMSPKEMQLENIKKENKNEEEEEQEQDERISSLIK